MNDTDDTFIPNNIFCCPGFQHSVEAAGVRGVAVIVVNTLGKTRFLLQSRGIDFDDVGKLRPRPDAPDIKINIACEIGLQYCPACGRKLEELITTSPDAFEELAKKHKKFYTGP